jgi:3-polyprenyl-4-hydroxybenzoate decarboxylase
MPGPGLRPGGGPLPRYLPEDYAGINASGPHYGIRLLDVPRPMESVEKFITGGMTVAPCSMKTL